jgi:hypothetical protein
MGDAMTRIQPATSDDLPVQDSVQIVRLGHIEYRVKTIRWKLDDPRRQTLWGPPPPRRWFEEYMQVESLETGELVEVSAPISRAIPTYVD